MRRRQRPGRGRATSWAGCSDQVMRMSYAKAYGIRLRFAELLGWRGMTTDEPLPRVLEILWRDAPPARRTRGLSREAIVAAAIELVQGAGPRALSLARRGR